MYLAPSGSWVDSELMATENTRRTDATSVGRQSTQTRPDDQMEPPSTLGEARADCCSAKPAVRLVLSMPLPSGHPAELLMCAHHYRANRSALAQIGATAFDCGANHYSAEGSFLPAV